MAIDDTPGRTPLGAFYRSPMGALSKQGQGGVLVLMIGTSERREDAGDTYPISANWAANYAALTTAHAQGSDNVVVTVGLKRGGALNNASGNFYTTGTSMLVPAGFSYPDYIVTAEHTVTPNVHAGNITSTLSLAEIQSWYDIGKATLGSKPSEIYVLFQNDGRLKSTAPPIPYDNTDHSSYAHIENMNEAVNGTYFHIFLTDYWAAYNSFRTWCATEGITLWEHFGIHGTFGVQVTGGGATVGKYNTNAPYAFHNAWPFYAAAALDLFYA